MLPKTATAKFKLSGQSQTADHTRASIGGHAAALKVQAARALQGRPSVLMPHQSGGPNGTPGGAAQANWHDQVAQAAGAKLPTEHLHAAVDGLVQAKKLTPFQGQALKLHNGPLTGPHGIKTIHAIAAMVK